MQVSTKKIEVEAANIVLGKKGSGDRFSLKIFGFSLRFEISYLSTKQIIKLSRIQSRIDTDFDTDKEMFVEMLEKAGNLTLVCKGIAIATRRRIPFLYKIIQRESTLDDLYTLWQVVIKNSDSERFFFIMASARGMNQMMRKAE